METAFFEVEIRNRVVSGLGERRIKGTQGNWHKDRLLFLAESELEAKEFAEEQISKKRVLGIPKRTRRRIRRQIEILEIRRIA